LPHLAQEKVFAREGFLRFKPSKHPLAVELEREKDAAGENFQLISSSLRVG
jgi:hypothetical protein